MAPRNRIASDVAREWNNPALIEQDLDRIIEQEGFLTRNHLLDGTHILRAFNVYLAERMSPETIHALNYCPSSYYLAWSAFTERARYERKLKQKNIKNSRPSQKTEKATTNV